MNERTTQTDLKLANRNKLIAIKKNCDLLEQTIINIEKLTYQLYEVVAVHRLSNELNKLDTKVLKPNDILQG